jgi:PPM family protein phosphatase
MGGHPAGDVASATVIESLRPLDDQPIRPVDLATTLGRAVGAANDAVRRRISAAPETAGMGSTLVALLWSGSTAVLANVGDSRAYLLRGQTRQITEDHVYQHLVSDAGDAPGLAERLTRFLDGRRDGRSPDVTTWNLVPGDRFLLCSDGLSSFVPHDLIHAALSAPDSPAEKTDRLIALAIDQGTPDNVTAVVMDIRPTEQNAQKPNLG